MKCLETRKRGGLTHRRYRDADGVIHHTVEVPREAWTFLNRQGRGNDRLAAHSRRRERLRLRAEAERLIGDGWKPLAVAHELSVPVRTVQRWRLGS